MNICVFGASITYGYYDLEMGGYVNRIRYYLENEKNFDDQIFNLGVSGATTEDLLERFDAEAKARRPEKIIISVSTNDTQFLIQENKQRIILEECQKNVTELINKARNYTSDIAIIGITPVDDEKTNPLPWATDKIVQNKNIELYNDKVKQVCEKEKIKFIDLYSEMVKIDYKKLLFDGLHPNSEGHKWMAERIIRELNL